MSELSIENTIMDCAKRVAKRMNNHAGIALKMRQRGKFEHWIHAELVREIAESNCVDEIETEYELSGKTGKKGRAVDITLKKVNEMIALEIKLIATSYKVDGIQDKTKSMPESVDEFIHDLTKVKGEPGFTGSMSLAFVYPMPVTDRNKNNDWPKQVKKMKDFNNSKLTESVQSVEIEDDLKIGMGIYLLESV